MLNKFLERLIGLAANNNEVVGIKRWYAGYSDSARPGPIFINLGREAALSQNPSSADAIESDRLGDLD